MINLLFHFIYFCVFISLGEMDSFIKFYFFYPFFVLFFHVISVTQKHFFFIFALLHINIYMLHIL